MAHPAVTDFLRALDSFDRPKTCTEIFRIFCEMAYCALAKRASPFPDQRDRLEADYMSCVGMFPNKDDVRRMPDMMALALQTIAAGGVDFFGQVAAEIGALDARMGQFFTPYEVSRMMAEMILGDVSAQIEAQGFITISEPAAGAGGMVLAVADVIERQGFDPARHIWVEAVELSRATFHMAYVQIAARGVAGRVINGNSLSLETYEQAFTPGAPVFHVRNGHPFAKQREAEQQAAEVEKAAQGMRRELLRDSVPATARAVWQ
ncbi:N-6 DNA methylase [Paracoccus sp. R12_1]|uniref:N-6 DNA methylase n=1 Tax=unclassified Paracoccus (in: a-proteobacteria) TaxID=2688777 RepID=UPI001ADD1E57|nr:MULTISPECIES: N-6 DNA methylase [unclassified Paracoccus (in: a-proteobacteria)]MBO9457403.1 N-6 DNA methylase [Paracoccus sp. R12_2]MBO9488680.1 N-6 DNA methylase [Paracoccus sp. R12_1]